MTEAEIGSLETEMNRGFLHILVLALLEKDMYGYAMAKHIEGLGYKVEENTLYPLLRRLEKNGWITSKWEIGRGQAPEILRHHRGGTRPARAACSRSGKTKTAFWKRS